MTAIAPLPSQACAQRGRTLAWLARWMLVLVLGFDQAGSPLHTHQHDSGIDGRAVRQAHVDLGAHALHVQEQPTNSLHHANLAVRSQARPLAALAPADSGSTALSALPAAPLAPAPLRGDALVPPVSRATAPSFARSLRPAVRAPPLHA